MKKNMVKRNPLAMKGVSYSLVSRSSVIELVEAVQAIVLN